MFADLEAGKYKFKSAVNFIYNNVAYADDYFTISDTLLEKDLLLDSVKFDFCPLRVGNEYTFFAKYHGPTGDKEQIIKITIINSGSSGNYYFDGIENSSTGSVQFTGYFKNVNSLFLCVVSGGVEELIYFLVFLEPFMFMIVPQQKTNFYINLMMVML